jgi:hypothetical protein
LSRALTSPRRMDAVAAQFGRRWQARRP